MSKYAEGTSVDTGRSRIELEKLLRRFGADQFAYAWDESGGREMLGFRIANRQVRIDLPMPDIDDPEFRLTPTGQVRSTSAARDRYDQEVRRRWRSLVLIVKAKLTAVADGISTIEREFLADLVIADGRTLSQWLEPQLEDAYNRGEIPALLPGLDE